MDISVSLQFHNEGWLAHPTLRALHRVVRHAEERGKAVEVVVTLDRTNDEVLRRIVGQWGERFAEFQVHEVDLGDPALCRNFAVEHARGRYIAPHDGDNLYGEDWLAKAHDHLLERPGCIAHPQLIWIFQGRSVFWVQAPVDDVADLIPINPWDTVCLARREVFERVPYRGASRAFAYEDWAWNCDTIHAGFEHVFVPETIVAKRQKPGEQSNEGAWLRSGKTFPRAPLIASVLRTPAAIGAPSSPEGQSATAAFSPPSQPPHIRVKEAFKRRYPATYQRLLRTKSRLTGKPRMPLNPGPGPTPAWAVQELDRLSSIEPALGDYRRFETISNWKTDLARWITPEMGRLLDAERPTIVLLSRLERGDGTIESLRAVHAGGRPLFVILTGEAEEGWGGEAPAGCTVVDLTVMDVVRPLKLALLHRLILESRADLLHAIDSREAFELFVAHPASFEGTRRWVTVACTGPKGASEVPGSIAAYLPRLLGFFDRISTDDEACRGRLIERFGLPEESVVVEPAPLPSSRSGPVASSRRR